MTEYLVFQMPDRLARGVISDGAALPVMQVKAPDASEVFHIVVDAINTGSAAVSVAVAINGLRKKFAYSLIRNARRESDEFKSPIIRRDGAVGTEIHLDLEDQEAVEALIQSLEVDKKATDRKN